MSYTNTAKLAIISCPGGEIFANEVSRQLGRIYRRHFKQMLLKHTKRYNISLHEAAQQINLISKTLFAESYFYISADKTAVPNFKIPANFTFFANSEVKAEIMESVRGKDVYIFQDVENRYPVFYSQGGLKKNLSVNDHLMTALVTVDAVRNAGARRITLVIPNFPYARQHKSKGREAQAASRIGKIFESLGVNHIIAMDIHSRDIVSSFNTLRLENLHASYQIIKALASLDNILNDDFVVVSPDTGAVDRNKFFASALKKPLALLYKERDYSKASKDALENNISQIRLLGSVQGKTVFMADDMLGTGGTLLEGMRVLKENGAQKIICSVSLPLFSGDAISHFDAAYSRGLFYRIIGTNAIYHEEVLKREWYINVNISNLFAHVIMRLHHNRSISSLLDNRDMINRFVEALSAESQPELPFKRA